MCEWNQSQKLKNGMDVVAVLDYVESCDCVYGQM